VKWEVSPRNQDAHPRAEAIYEEASRKALRNRDGRYTEEGRTWVEPGAGATSRSWYRRVQAVREMKALKPQGRIEMEGLNNPSHYS